MRWRSLARNYDSIFEASGGQRAVQQASLQLSELKFEPGSVTVKANQPVAVSA
jgi:hypothetical protein